MLFLKARYDNNEVIRTFKQKADTGFNRNYWGFETKGIRQPGSAKPKPNSPEPRGSMSVFPGTYKMVIAMGKEADSTMLVVKADPAVQISRQVYDAQSAALKRIEKSTLKVVAITDRLSEAEEIIAKVEAQLKNIEGSDADSLRKSGKAMTDSIKKIRNFIMGTPQEKQGYGSPYEATVTGWLREAKGEVLGKIKIPDAQEFNLIEIAEGSVDEAIKKTNMFFNGKWKDYQQQADNTPMKSFKDFMSIE